MLNFFRKYQRYFFIFVAIFITLSFSFFGVQYAVGATSTVKPKEIGKAFDGSAMWSNEIEELTRLIATDQFDFSLSEKRISPNWLNDGVIRTDFLKSGLAISLINAYFEELRGDVSLCLQKHRRYRPYQHPHTPMIGVANLYEQFASQEWEKVETFLSEEGELSPRLFSDLIDLYFCQEKFPSRIIRQYLLFQEQNYPNIPRDPRLQTCDLNLFHASSLEDWFGPRFIQLIAQFIHNAALLSQERGYEVSEKEVRLDLIQNGLKALRREKGQKNHVEQEEVAGLYHHQLQALHLTEKQALKGWRKVLLFRRFFQDYGDAVMCDSALYKTFYPSTSKTAYLNLYQLPASLENGNMRTFLKLNLYVNAVSPSSLFSLPKTFYSVKKIENKFPELVHQTAFVETAEVTLEEIAATVGLKEMWEWQLKDENYALLEREFPSLAFKKENTADAYFSALENLSPKERGEVDRFSRMQIVREHPEWIKETLEGKKVCVKEMSFSEKGKGVFLGKEWVDLMKAAALKGEINADPQALEKREKLFCFTADEKTYSRFEILERDEEKKVLTFTKANEKGILDTLLDRKLKEEYEKRRNLFEGKSFDEVKEEIEKLVYAKVFSSRGESFSFPLCLVNYLKEAKADIQLHGEKSGFLSLSESLEGQWALQSEKKEFRVSEVNSYFDEKVFDRKEGTWSSILGGKEKAPYFFQLEKIAISHEPNEEEIGKEQKILSKEAQTLLMEEVLTLFSEKGGIHFSSVKGE